MYSLIILFSLFIIGFFCGKWHENQHIKSLQIREHALASILVVSLKRLPANINANTIGLVSGSSVIATDYFKIILSSFRSLFGGELKSFESLLIRGRREAHIRMLTEAQAAGANTVINVRYQTTTMGNKRKVDGIEIFAYGTALLTES